MKRCRICRLDYPFNHTVCPTDGALLEEAQRSSAVAPVIEIHRSSPPPPGSEEEGRRGGWTLPEDFREFLEDLRLRKSFLELGARGFHLQLCRSAVSMGLLFAGVAAMGVGLWAILADMASGHILRWLADIVFAVGMTAVMVKGKGFGRAVGLTFLGLTLLANTLDLVALCFWPLLAATGGGFLLLYRQRARFSGMTMRFVY